MRSVVIVGAIPVPHHHEGPHDIIPWDELTKAIDKFIQKPGGNVKSEEMSAQDFVKAVRLSDEQVLGRKDDQGKVRLDLMPPRAEWEVAAVLTHGAQKYDDENWRKVPDPVKRYEAAAKRHISRWKRGQRSDVDSSRHHLAHAICSLMFILELELEEEKSIKRSTETQEIDA